MEKTMQGGVAHLCTVGRSATAVKSKVNGQFKIIIFLSQQSSHYIYLSNRSRVKQNFSHKTHKSVIDAMLQ